MSRNGEIVCAFHRYSCRAKVRLANTPFSEAAFAIKVGAAVECCASAIF